MANKYDSQVGYVQDAPDPSSPKNQPGVAQAAVDGQTSASKNVVTMPTGILGDATVPALTKDKFPQFDLAGKDFTPYIPGPSERVGNTRYHADNYSPHDDDREVEINDGNTHITVDGGHVHVEQDGDHTTINIDGGHTTIDIDNDQPHSGHTTINIDSDDDHVYHGHDGEHHYGGHDDDDDHGDHDHDYHGDDGDDHGQPPGEQPKAQLNQDQQAVLEDIRRAAGNPADAQYYLHDAAHRLKSMGFDLGNPLANTGNLTAAQTDRLISQLGLDEKDYGGPTGPVDFLSWYGRLLSHDEQINGAAGDAGNGNIFEQIAADGFSTTNGQAATFAPDTKQANWLMAAIAWSLDKNDNGEFQIDGRAERDIGLGLTFAKAAGGSGILNELNDMPDHAANLDLSVANRFAPDPMKPGGMQQLGWTSGWSQTQIGIDAIVGHAMINGGRLTDDEMSDFFAHAGDMNVDPIDAGLLMASPEAAAWVQRMANADHPAAAALNEWLSVNAQTLDPGLMAYAVGADSGEYGGGGDDDDNHYGGGHHDDGDDGEYGGGGDRGAGGEFGLGDVMAEIFSGLSGNDQTGLPAELIALFPELTQYIEEQTGAGAQFA